MNLQASIHVLSRIIIVIGAFLATPAVFGMIYAEEITYIYLICSMTAILAGVFTQHLTRVSSLNKQINTREGFFIVSMGWMALAFFGALPFYLASEHTGQFASFTDAFFESMSGFTTTGASVLRGDFELKTIESLPKSLLFWRSIIQWIGGMGIILFSLMVLSALGIGGMMLYQAEVPGPVPDKITPTVSSTAKILWRVYIILSLIEFLALWLFGYGMPFFDAMCHTFTTMATGGFSTKDLSMGHYAAVGDPLAVYYELVVTLFMFIAGVNFVLHYQVLMGKPGHLFGNPEFRFYTLIVLVASITITADVILENPVLYFDLSHYMLAVKDSLFTVVSVLTTTGFGTADFDTWPNYARGLLLILMFIGGCAGSTAGGMKVMRIMILLKHSHFEMLKFIHSRAAYSIRFGTQVISSKVLKSVISFSILFFFLYAFGVLLLTIDGMSLESAFSAVIACFGNIGPGLSEVGPSKNYADLSDMSKWILAMLMLVGRLEIYPVLILLIPNFWRR